MERIDLDIWTAKEVARILTLVENETRYYQEILAQTPIPLAVVGRDLSFSSVNRAFRRSFQLKHEDAAQRRLDELLPPAVVKDRVLRVLDSYTPEAGVAFRAVDGEGVGRACRLTVIPLPSWYREKSDEALVVVEEQEQAMPAAARLLEELDAAAWRIDAESGEMEFANRGMERLLGSSSMEGWAKRIHPDDQTRVAWVYEAALESGAAAAVEYRAVRSNGTVTWLADHIQPVTAQGKVTTLQILTTEESQRRARLERLVQTREMEAGMRLARQVAHEFNNLWMVVNGCAEILGERIGPEDEEAQEWLNDFREASARGVATSQQLLQFGRPATAQMQTLDLNEFLRRSSLPGELRLAAGGQPVSVDAGRLQDALRMLIARVSPKLPMGSSLVVETGRQTLISDYADGLPRGQFVTLRVGPLHGVNQQMLAHWAEPYYTGVEKPAAIGLAGLYSTIRQMGGWIALEREQADTAAFLLHFPLASMPAPVPVPQVVEKPAVETAARETVLMIDDDESIRRLVQRALSPHGYEVLTAAGAEEALGLAGAYGAPIHMVVSDVALEGMRGPEVVAALREKRPELRVLYISGYTDDPAMSAGILPPGEGFLQKPFALTTLVSTVRAVLDAGKD